MSAELARRADAVVTALDAGACDQALAEALALKTEVARLLVGEAAEFRPAAETAAERVVSGINCPPPTTTTAPPAESDESDPSDGRRPGKGKDNDKDDDSKDDDSKDDD